MSGSGKDLAKFASAVPGSIREAAKSPLGYASLSTIALCGLAYFLFGNSSDGVKIAMFILLVFAVLFFFAAVHFASDTRLLSPGPLLQPPEHPARDGKGRFVPKSERDRATPEDREVTTHE